MARWLVVASFGLASVACWSFESLMTGDRPPSSGDGGAADGGADATVEGSGDGSVGGCTGGLVPGPNGTCVATCGAITCAPHEACDNTASPAACACIAGYTAGPSGCTFSAGPADPGFQNTPPAWQVEPLDGGAIINPVADGGVDPGTVQFSNGCQAGLVRQTFSMPPYALAEPLALELSVKSGLPMAIEVRIAGRPFPVTIPANTGYQTLRVCLGESAYGGDVELAMRRTNQCGGWEIDRATIVPDPSCLAAGAILSPDFQSPGWTAADGAETTTQGLNGLSGRLVATDACSVPMLTGKIHIPISIARPALAVSYKGTANVWAELSVSGARFETVPQTIARSPFARLDGTGALERVNVCLPQWARGTIRSLMLSMPARGGCGTARNDEFLFDDLAIVDDPTCADPAFVFDPGFEQAAQGAKVVYAGGPASLDFSPTYFKITGPGALYVKSRYPDCSSEYSTKETASVFASVPAAPTSTSPGAPRLTFKYRTSGSTSASWSAEGVALAASPSPTTSTMCLPRTLGGQGTSLDFSVIMGCPSSTAELAIDDIELAWDSACP